MSERDQQPIQSNPERFQPAVAQNVNTDEPGRPAGPPEFAPEAGGPGFAKGERAAGAPTPAHLFPDRPLTDEEQMERGSAEPRRY